MYTWTLPMNLVADFYSKPAHMASFPIYGKVVMQQRGGGGYSQGVLSPEKQRGVRKTTAQLLAGLYGLVQGITAYKKVQRAYRDRR